MLTLKDFGKDHWNMLLYIETRAVDYGGRLDRQHMRIKQDELKGGRNPLGWKPEYGTRLSGYFSGKFFDRFDKTRLLPDHDDMDCLDDFERLGLIKQVGSALNPAIKMTEEGNRIAFLLRVHKQNGGQCADFTIN